MLTDGGFWVTFMVMVKTSVATIKAHLSEYLDRALAGERIVICRHNAPVVELRPIEAARVEARPLGPLAGRPAFDVPASFFEPLPDQDLDEWEGMGRSAPLDNVKRAAPRVAEGRATHSGPKERPRRPRRR